MSQPLLTVALCTHNHAGRLVRTLQDLQVLKPIASGWEFLVIDNGSTDATPTLLAEKSWQLRDIETRVLREERLGLSNARNRALGEARGEYILFMDDDETPDPSWLIAYERAILDHRPDALGGRIEVLFEDGARPAWLQDDLLGFLGKLDHGEPKWLKEATTPIFGGNFAFRQTIFDRIGNFDKGLGRQGTLNIGGEDTEMYQRLLAHGHRVRWVPEAIIHHRIQSTKLQRRYFLDLHYREGFAEGARAGLTANRPPPLYAYNHLLRAARRALLQRLLHGSHNSLRLEMNAFYQLGYIRGWRSERRASSISADGEGS